jgi:adenylate kinase family enzyme
MNHRTHILGASGSGTTTLAKALAERLRCKHFDTDDYYWMKTDPPFTTKNSIEDRVRNLSLDLGQFESWTLSGSLVSWGEAIASFFSCVIFLYVPTEIRLQRLYDRERLRHGKRIELGGDMHLIHKEFIEWASKYDSKEFKGRSLQVHESWLKQLSCPVIRIDREITTENQVDLILSQLGD